MTAKKAEKKPQTLDAKALDAVVAGAGGTFTLPEVGDEVLLGSQQGDSGQPVVTGRLWNGRDTRK